MYKAEKSQDDEEAPPANNEKTIEKSPEESERIHQFIALFAQAQCVVFAGIICWSLGRVFVL
ncbi:hypothetical protein OCU04_002052 [Sclerotinia nivalis]|uniref:Uncharacterized protein n=1 Tax=Sclerotinia nivalis TaxID=352851 RepID=A0A9X0AZD5_9HELO|nr:hypothetical protein OCU04_002052 [Sclerotinia nivalis]